MQAAIEDEWRRREGEEDDGNANLTLDSTREALEALVELASTDTWGTQSESEGVQQPFTSNSEDTSSNDTHSLCNEGIA
jgi:hypothetical protein